MLYQLYFEIDGHLLVSNNMSRLINGSEVHTISKCIIVFISLYICNQCTLCNQCTYQGTAMSIFNTMSRSGGDGEQEVRCRGRGLLKDAMYISIMKKIASCMNSFCLDLSRKKTHCK